MSNSSQLPEVDSLPDGFVESSSEPLHQPTTTTEAEMKALDHKGCVIEDERCTNSISEESENARETASTVDDTKSIIQATDSSDLNALGSAAFLNVESSSPEESDKLCNKVEKKRNFPVPLSDKDALEHNFGSLDVSGPTNDGEHKEDVTKPEDLIPTTEDCLEMLSSLHDRSVGQGKNNLPFLKSLYGNTSLLIAAKSLFEDCIIQTLGSLTAGKAKHASKRSSKSEKELLELTWKFQQAIVERDSAIAVREKLESLCRELQRQNKMLMNECKRVSEDGQNMRSELSVKFHDAIKDVSSKLEQQKDDYLSQLKENEMLRNKLKHLTEQFTVAEEQFTQQMKKKTLELQLAELKLQQLQEKSSQEESMMQMYTEQVSQMLANEKSLRMQLASDGEKFQQFQEALSKSNEVFETFKQEMEKMGKTIKELKKENAFLKNKCEKSDFTLIKLVDEREATKKQMEKMKNQEKLESLCRSLQAERRQSSSESLGDNQISEQVKTSLS